MLTMRRKIVMCFDFADYFTLTFCVQHSERMQQMRGSVDIPGMSQKSSFG